LLLFFVIKAFPKTAVRRFREFLFFGSLSIVGVKKVKKN